MWLMTTDGFISAVEHRNDPSVVMVRARKKEHLEQLTNRPDQIYSTTPSDYPWRIEITKEQLKTRLCVIADNIKYDNFKNAVPDHNYKRFLERVWFEGFGYGQLINRRGSFKQMTGINEPLELDCFQPPKQEIDIKLSKQGFDSLWRVVQILNETDLTIAGTNFDEFQEVYNQLSAIAEGE
ncbi:hypothetical protein tloyanaT_13260 [Thalassotalea loyana]|uniref:Uncharacterized protein n=1 Tax=Thalassotalea loyana TaxID=280483 RepID=A0ABQ6HC02_9GAMM|nr:hypothetical protein [Thalassotalea loyana]GLX85074.1 hypothetical protein tloyanaT_13260 [Thalassotalea loyana]